MLLFSLCLLISCKDYTVDGARFFDDMVTSGVSVQMQFHFVTQTFHLVCITTCIFPQIMSWCITGALLLVLVLYIGLNMVFCRRCTSSDDEDASQGLLDKPEPAKKRGEKKEKGKKEKKEKKEKARSKITSNSSNNPFL